MKPTNEKKLKKELQIAVELAKEASKAILPFYYGNLKKETKQDGTPVTNADKLANKIIFEGLREAFPNDGIVSEEMNSIEGQRTWYIDPIDGTKGFIGHSDQFAIHIGLAKKSPLLGLVYKPTTGEYFSSIKGQGAFRVNPDGSKKGLYVAGNREGLAIIVNTSFLREERDLTDKLNPNKIQVSGSLGLRAMQVANGTVDAYLKARKTSGGTWDICAPQAIVEEAGGHVAYTDGTTPTYHGQRELKGRLTIAKNEDIGKYVNSVMEKYAVG
jgi:3'(2'), 5'-bisphosphate nucleotidase